MIMQRDRYCRRGSIFAGLTVLALLSFGGRWTAAEETLPVGEAAQLLHDQMSHRGDPPAEIHLALAALFARAKREPEMHRYLAEARAGGIAASRCDLILGDYFRSVGRCDAAMSTLVRVLIRHEDQPYALLALWKTLYECKLQGAEVKTDTDAIRERLSASGLHFPQSFALKPRASATAKRLTAAGYNALLGGNPELAAGLFEAAVDALPSWPHAHRGLGIARARRGDHTRAAGAYLLYLELLPLAPDADEVDRVLMEYWKQRP